jgi:hypothetical protein
MRAMSLVLAFFSAIVIGSASAQSPLDYLVQQVCVDGNNTPIAADPVTCPNNRRPLLIGEALPYHKIDFTQIQYSDSFPVSDASGVSRAVQTYFYKSDLNINDLFPNMVHFNPLAGGYNIIGANSSYVFFRGTFDQGGGWQPWWTPDCSAEGWKLFPSTSAAFSYGGASSPAAFYPSCPGLVTTGAATVEWNSHNVTYATGKTLHSIVDFFYAPGYGAIEANYFTREYGVTRWEAWRLGNNQTPQYIKDQCPNSLYDAYLHGNNYYLADCHDWSTVTFSAAPWNPAGRSPVNPAAVVWPVDPLYTSVNYLQNTYVGGPYSNFGATQCLLGPWQRINHPTVLNWAWETTSGLPWTSNGNCTLIFSVPAAPAGEVLFQEQAIPLGSSGSATYGALLWARDYTSGPKPTARLQIFQADAGHNLLQTSSVTVELNDRPTAFSGEFEILEDTQYVRLAIYPNNGFVNYEITGAWVSPSN